MRTLFLALIAAAALAGCASPDRSPRAAQRGHAGPDAAAFMGYHGPVWRQNTPSD